MILVTGGTGFIGQVLVQRLVDAGLQVRLLVRPSKKTPRLPRGAAIEVAVTSLQDERGLRAAMAGVNTVFHLAGGEKRGVYASLLEDDILGTQTVVTTAQQANIDHLFYLSHLGAERSSAYPVFKAKAIAEEHVKRSQVDYTIIRSAVVYGHKDGFTTLFASLLRRMPFFFPLPGDGGVKLQPIWVEDLVACFLSALEDRSCRNRTFEVGGGEYLSFLQILETISEQLGIRRNYISFFPPYLRALVVFLEGTIPSFPISIFWLDYLAVNRTCSIDTLPRAFNLIPAQFSHHLEHLTMKKKTNMTQQNNTQKKHTDKETEL